MQWLFLASESKEGGLLVFEVEFIRSSVSSDELGTQLDYLKLICRFMEVLRHSISS
jgi:hypothetical protein